uniref:Uncharacterized protein n=1 Tax=Caenorhabditis japonica TaxID=281687 RepID=A0A8R1J1Q8_CAEJA
MREDLKDLHEYAKKYDDELFQKGYYDTAIKPRSKPKNINLTVAPALRRSNFTQLKQSGNERVEQLGKELDKLCLNRSSFSNLQRRESPTSQFSSDAIRGRGDTSAEPPERITLSNHFSPRNGIKALGTARTI